MIRAFNVSDRTFATNGDTVISAIKCRVKNSDNGDYYLELYCDTKYTDYLKDNNIIVAPTPSGYQAFRIREVTRKSKRLEVTAWHVFYDADNYVIVDSYAEGKTCGEALAYFNSATDNPSPFTTYSDITSVYNMRTVRKSLAETISDILERWGGHLVRNNWNISILSSIGVDNGVTIQYRKNLQELTASYDWTNVVTKLLPVGKDGLLLDELWIYSDIQYSIPYSKCVSFEQDIDPEDYPSEEAYMAALVADLRAQATEYVNTYCYPSVNYTLKGNPEKVSDLGDIIRVKDERIGVDILTKVIAYEYDCIAERYVELEFGNFSKSLNDLMSDISKEVNLTTGQAVSGKQDKLVAGDNITIQGDVISANAATYTAGENITIIGGVISAKDTTYTAGDNITIINDVISAEVTEYAPGYGIDIDNDTISAETLEVGETYAYPAYMYLPVVGYVDLNGMLHVPLRLQKPWNDGNLNITILDISIFNSMGQYSTADISAASAPYVLDVRKITPYDIDVMIYDDGQSAISDLNGDSVYGVVVNAFEYELAAN